MDANYRYSISKGEIYAKQGEKREKELYRSPHMMPWSSIVIYRSIDHSALPCPCLPFFFLVSLSISMYEIERERRIGRRFGARLRPFPRFFFISCTCGFFYFLIEIIRQVTEHVATSARLSRLRFRRQIVIVDFGDILIEILQIQLFLIDYLTF